MKEYYHLRPNNLLKDEMIMHFKGKGLKTYCIGGGVKLDDGIYRYKKTFAKCGEKDFFVGKKVHNNGVYNELCRRWEEEFPKKAEENKGYFLRYKL